MSAPLLRFNKLRGTLSAHTAQLPQRTPIEIWFQDEARIGRKNWPRTPMGQNRHQAAPAGRSTHESAYLFGAICPARGVGGSLALPRAITQSMQAHLEEISATVAAEGAYVVLLLDRAGWHTTPERDVPDNLMLIFMPSCSPELHSVENIWQHLRDNKLSNRVFVSYEVIIDRLRGLELAHPKTITSIGRREWANIGQT